MTTPVASRGPVESYVEAFDEHSSNASVPWWVQSLGGGAVDGVGGRGVAAATAVVLIAINLVQFRGYSKSTIPHDQSTAATYARFWALTLRIPAIERRVSSTQ